MLRGTQQGSGNLSAGAAPRTDGNLQPAGASRRGFLSGTGLATMGAVIGGTMPFSTEGGLIPAAAAQGAAAPAAPKGPQFLKFPGKNEGLILLGDRPLVAETPESLLDDDTTPIEKFYIRNNGQIPEEAKDPDAWKIVFDGQVDNKLEITLGELKKKYQAVTYRMVLECGGNGRAAFSPPARGNQWSNGGAGCAEWTGVRLADVLKDAKPKSSAIYTAHYAADLHLSGDATKQPISRGVRLEKAMEPHTLIVWAMNGKPLPNIHGGPVRLVVPGWAGSASQKWLTRISLLDKEHDGPGMTEFSYRVPIKPMIPGDKGDPKNFKILESMPVRSIVTVAGERRQAPGRHQGDRVARRLLGRRPDGEAGRRLDRLGRDLAARDARASRRTSSIGSAGPRP